MRDYNIEPPPRHNPDYEDGQRLSTNTTHTQWLVPIADEVCELNTFFNNPNARDLLVGERRGGMPGVNLPGNEINPFSFYEWHRVFPRPIVLESDPSDQHTWFRSAQNIGTRDYNYKAFTSSRYPRPFFLNGHIILLDPEFNSDGSVRDGIRLSLQTIRRKNLAVWELTLQQQSDNAQVPGYDPSPSQRVFSWGFNPVTLPVNS